MSVPEPNNAMGPSTAEPNNAMDLGTAEATDAMGPSTVETTDTDAMGLSTGEAKDAAAMGPGTAELPAGPIQGHYWPDIRGQLLKPADWDRLSLKCFVCYEGLVLNGLAITETPGDQELETAVVTPCGHIIGHKCYNRLFPPNPPRNWENLFEGHIRTQFQDMRDDGSEDPGRREEREDPTCCPICRQSMAYTLCRSIIEPLPLPSTFDEVSRFPRMILGPDAVRVVAGGPMRTVAPNMCYYCAERSLLHSLTLHINRSGNRRGPFHVCPVVFPGNLDWIAVNPRTRTVLPYAAAVTVTAQLYELTPVSASLGLSKSLRKLAAFYAADEWGGLYPKTRRIPDGHKVTARESWILSELLQVSFLRRRDLSSDHLCLYAVFQVLQGVKVCEFGAVRELARGHDPRLINRASQRPDWLMYL